MDKVVAPNQSCCLADPESCDFVGRTTTDVRSAGTATITCSPRSKSLLLERETGLEPATSTLGNIRQQYYVVYQRPLHLGLSANCPELYAGIHAVPW
jgi:hypothetical protein